MKKKILCLLLGLIVFIVSCTPIKTKTKNDYTKVDYDELRAVWISYYDYDFTDDNEESAKLKIDTMFDNISQLNLNTVFLHIRANADSLYKSNLFPYFELIKNLMAASPEFDILEYMIKCAHKRGIKLHAWFNPYRISNKFALAEELPDGHIAKRWFLDGNEDNAVISFGEKLYFNPAVTRVQKLIIDGVREVIENYDIDGIHFDDYFYPECDETFDKVNYEAYCESTTLPLSLTQWRTANVNALVAAVKNIAKQSGLPFGISPSAHIYGDYIEKNGYADIEKWLQSDDYVDYVIPQIYWGFDYPATEYDYENMLKKWVSLKRNDSVKLYIGLAAYKIGTEDQNNEWIKNTDILKRQILSLRAKNVRGFSLFSYSYLFSTNENNKKEFENIIPLLN